MVNDNNVGIGLQYNKPYYDARLKYTDAIGKTIDKVQEATAAGDLRGLYMILVSYSEMTFPFLQEPGPETRKKLLGVDKDGNPKDLEYLKRDCYIHFNKYNSGASIQVEAVFFKNLMSLYRYLMICTRLLLLPTGSSTEIDMNDEDAVEKFTNQALKEMGL